MRTRPRNALARTCARFVGGYENYGSPCNLVNYPYFVPENFKAGYMLRGPLLSENNIWRPLKLSWRYVPMTLFLTSCYCQDPSNNPYHPNGCPKMEKVLTPLMPSVLIVQSCAIFYFLYILLHFCATLGIFCLFLHNFESFLHLFCVRFCQV